MQARWDAYVNRPEKQRLRARLLREVVSLNKPNVSLLTLPGETWVFEKMLYKALPDANVRGFERDKRRYNTALATAPPKAVLELGDIGTALGETLTDVTWLDLCCPLTPVVEEMFISAIQSTRDIFCFTLMVARDLYGFQHPLDRDLCITSILHSACGDQWHLRFMERYKDSMTPMEMWCLRRR